MSRRPVMFIPSNFTVNQGSTVKFSNCRFFSKDMFLWVKANCFKDKFSGNEKIDGWDIITEDSIAVFKDKIDTLTGKQEENLL
ncbi:hypothetical protein MOE90_20350 [Bacillus spizizenii]|nr:hypothetical protein [Bacillus spizizenii]MCY9124953.1 hypothetical protein [Bacillus spizizenii]